MAYRSVLVAIITAYLSVIVYGTPLSETVAPIDEQSTTTDLFNSTRFSELSTLIEDDTTDKGTDSKTPAPVHISVEADENNFTAIWQIDDDDYEILVLWSESRGPPVGWTLNISRESDNQMNQSQIIDSSCSWNNNSRRHQVKLEKLHSITYELYSMIPCNSQHKQVQVNFTIKPCLAYNLLLVPHDDQHPIRKTKLKPVVKWTPNIASVYSSRDRKLKITWDHGGKEWRHCDMKYRYDLNFERDNISVSNTTNQSSIEIEAEYCTNYFISVWSIAVDNDIHGEEPVRHAGRTASQGFNMTDLKINTRAINETCIMVKWSLNVRLIVGCEFSFRILVHSPSEKGQHSSIIRSDKQTQEEMICHLRPGTEYKVCVLLDDLPSIDNCYKSILTPSPPDSVTLGLICVSSVLLLILLVILLYCIQPWFSRHDKRSQSVGLKSSFFGNMGRRRSHPVKLRNLNSVTQRLCSSAGHLLEMEFEDLVIIADARRPRDSPIGLLAENAIKNRYVNILPYEHNRVPLSLLPDCPDSNYINASYVMGFNHPKEYIATQGPKMCTIEDFWRMVCEQNVHIIIMVTTLEERGKPKCDRYWPEDAENPITFDGLSISQLNETDFASYIVRTLKILRNGKSRIVKQACLKGWPDFGVPDNPEILIQFIEVVRIIIKETSSTLHMPIVVHCSAGVGRTGTFIAVDWLMQEARIEKEIDIFSTILRMRECRLNMVQSEEQYEYIYRCMCHFVNTRLFATREQSLDAENLLANGNNPLLMELE